MENSLWYRLWTCLRNAYKWMKVNIGDLNTSVPVLFVPRYGGCDLSRMRGCYGSSLCCVHENRYRFLSAHIRCHLHHAVPCDFASVPRVSDSEEFHLLGFHGMYTNCDGVCIVSTFVSMKLFSSPFAFSYDCNVSVTSCVSLLSFTWRLPSCVSGLCAFVFHHPTKLPASCLSSIISNGFKSNIYNIRLNWHL
jgi:hypothetical protein